MSILSGYKKFKKYLKTTDGYQLISYFTSSDTVNMVDENGNITDTTLTESISKVGKGRELTQAEYDALSEEEKNNGTVYYITDDEGVISVVALTREAYEALGNITSTDGRVYLITDESLEETAKNIAFDDTNTTIDASTVHDAIENIDSFVNALTTQLNNFNESLSTKELNISLNIDTSSLSSVKINSSTSYGKVVNIYGEVTIETPGVWKKIGTIPSEYRCEKQLYFPIFRLGEISKNIIYVNNNGTFGINSTEGGNYNFNITYIAS